MEVVGETEFLMPSMSTLWCAAAAIGGGSNAILNTDFRFSLLLQVLLCHLLIPKMCTVSVLPGELERHTSFNRRGMSAIVRSISNKLAGLFDFASNPLKEASISDFQPVSIEALLHFSIHSVK